MKILHKSIRFFYCILRLVYNNTKMASMLVDQEDHNNVRQLSQQVAYTVRQTSQNNNYQPPDEVAENIRMRYLAEVDGAQKIVPRLTKMAEMIAQETLNSVLSDVSSNTAPTIEEINLTIRHAGKEKSYIFNSENKYVTLGRLPGGDFESRHFHTGFFDCSVSRLMFMIVFLPNKKLAIIDFWSYLGTSMISYEGIDEKDYIVSVPGDRRVIIVDSNKSMIFKIGENTWVTFNPRECIICMDKSRDCVFNGCNHFVSCKDCANNISDCPICRKPINNLDEPKAKRICTQQKDE